MLRKPGLSKSRLTAFEQCAKRLWLQVHRPELAELDEGAEARFASGHEIGAIACSLVPDGRMIEAIPDLTAALEETRSLLARGYRRPLFEATLEHDGLLVRIDVMEPSPRGGWLMAEVKSSTRAKSYHLSDIATQVWVARAAGLTIDRSTIRHVDNTFVLRQTGDYRGLLTDTDVGDVIEPLIAERPAVVAAAKASLAGPEPTIPIGAHCQAPFPCEFANYCQAGAAEGPRWPVTVLPQGGGKRWIEAGVIDLLHLDADALESDVHKRVHRATVTGEPFHDAEAAKAAIDGWAYPRTWLDFETIAFAAPRWVGTRAYQQLPFQFSAHVETADGALTHHEFLSLTGEDPRHACAKALLQLPKSGAVVAYNAGFERRCLLDLAEAMPELAQDLRNLASRLVDLLPVTRATWYHRDQRGSWSIKAVLPTIAPQLAYSDLHVSDGAMAQQAYLEAIAPTTSPGRLAEIDQALRAYCGRDTEAMVLLARHLVTTAIAQRGAALER